MIAVAAVAADDWTVCAVAVVFVGRYDNTRDGFSDCPVYNKQSSQSCFVEIIHCRYDRCNSKASNNALCKMIHGESIYGIFLNYSIFLMPCFTGMRDGAGAGAGAGAGSGGGGAGLSLVMIASRW